MAKLLVCIDGSAYADNVCMNAAWVAKRLDAQIDLLHVLHPHTDYEAPADHTGSIGLGAKSDLLESLTQADEERGRLIQEKGKKIIDRAVKVLEDAGVQNVHVLYRRGNFSKTLVEFENSADMVFIGKRGDHAEIDTPEIGANLEKIARSVHCPLFVTSSVAQPIERFLIAYDGKCNAQRAIDYVCSETLLRDVDCHLLVVEKTEGDLDTAPAVAQLKNAGFTVTAASQSGDDPVDVIFSYVTENDVDLLITGAYSHSRVRNFLLGSTTTSLILKCKIPLLLFR